MKEEATVEERPAPSIARLSDALNVGSMRTLPHVRTGQETALQKQMEASAEAARLQNVGQREEAAAVQQAGRQRISADDEAVELYERRRQNIPTQFIPTQETAGDFATLFSLLAVAGQAIGGKGKASAMSAMSSMTGMLNGWRQGRVDLYQREKQNFETNLRAIQANNEEARRIMQDAMNRNKGRYDQAVLEARNKLLERGDQIAARTLEAQGYAGLSQLLNGRAQDIQHATQLAQQLANRAPERVRINGNWVYARIQDGKFVPIAGPDGQPMPAPPPPGSPEYVQAMAEARRSGSTAGSDRYGFQDITTTASNEAAAEIVNLVELAETSTSGIFQGRNTTGLLNAPLGALINQLTSEEAQRYNITINNFGKFLAQVQKGGRVVGQREMAAAAEPFIIREGDTPMTVLTRIAGMRQGLERAIEVRIASPNTPDSLRAIYQRNLDDIRQAIPFTVSDVNRFLSQGDQRRTFSDMIQESGVMGQGRQHGGASAQPQAGQAQESYVLNGRKIVVKDGRWVFEDDGSPAQ